MQGDGLHLLIFDSYGWQSIARLDWGVRGDSNSCTVSCRSDRGNNGGHGGILFKVEKWGELVV